MTPEARTILRLARTLYNTPPQAVAEWVYGDAHRAYVKDKACRIQSNPASWICSLGAPQLARLAALVEGGSDA
jgi:hypothetical protein